MKNMLKARQDNISEKDNMIKRFLSNQGEDGEKGTELNLELMRAGLTIDSLKKEIEKFVEVQGMMSLKISEL